MQNAASQRVQLAEQRLKVDFDTYDVTVDELVRRVQRGRIEIAPVYQRQFRWDEERQSKLIESILLGIPIPSLFMATNLTKDMNVQWEVVDGLQRLLTLVNFVGDDEARAAARLKGAPLRLSKLEKLYELNNSYFLDLPADIRSTLEDRPVKVIVLNDKSDLQVRFDLFERINTGGINLTDQEIRECVYRGPFMDCVTDLARSASFMSVLKLPESRWKDGTPEDFTIRFFAFLENYKAFDHSVKDFINNFVASAMDTPQIEERSTRFKETFDYLSLVFPDGIRSKKGVTPVNLFEGVAVGAALALCRNPNLGLPLDMSWMYSDTLRKMTTGATNSRPRVAGRIEFCRDKFRNGTLLDFIHPREVETAARW